MTIFKPLGEKKLLLNSEVNRDQTDSSNNKKKIHVHWTAKILTEWNVSPWEVDHNRENRVHI